MKPQLIAYSLNGSEHIYWILDLEGEVHSIYDLWISGLQECKGNGFFEVSRVGGQKFSARSIKSGFVYGGLPLPKSTSPEKFLGMFNVRHYLDQLEN